VRAVGLSAANRRRAQIKISAAVVEPRVSLFTGKHLRYKKVISED
jgi:hypothetical protein